MNRPRSVSSTATVAAALYGMYALAVIIPVNGMLVDTPEFFTLHSMTNRQILAFFAVLYFAPAALIAVYALLRRFFRPRGAAALEGLFTAAMTCLATAILLRQSNAPVGPAVALAIAGAAALIVTVLARISTNVVLFFAFIGILSPAAAYPLLSQITDRMIESAAAHVGIAFASRPESKPPNVLVVIFDELPLSTLMDAGGGIHATRFPAFAELASTSTWFRNAASVGCYSELAVPAILSGRMPVATPARPGYTTYPVNLFTILSGMHDMEAWEPITQMCPENLCARRSKFRPEFFAHHLALAYAYLAAPPRLTHLLPDLKVFWMTANEMQHDDYRARHVRYYDRNLHATNVERALEVAREPWLKVVHQMLPHHPYEYTRGGQVYDHGDPDLTGLQELESRAHRWTDAPAHVHQSYYRHTLQTAFTDAVLGRFMAPLKNSGQFDDTLVIVTADHGVAHRRHLFRRESDRWSYPFTAGVPLFVKLPRQTRGSVVDTPAQTLDIVPTIVGALGGRLGADVPFEGIDLFQSSGRTRRSGFRHMCIDPGRVGKHLEVKTYDAEIFPALLDEARNARKLFGDGAEPLQLYLPQREWIGRRPEEVGTAGESSDAISVGAELIGELEHTDLGGPRAPVHLSGRYQARDSRRGPRLVVAAVNGRIASVMPTIYEGPVEVYSAMIEKSSLRNGRNEVAFYGVETGGGTTRLRRLKLQLE